MEDMRAQAIENGVSPLIVKLFAPQAYIVDSVEEYLKNRDFIGDFTPSNCVSGR